MSNKKPYKDIVGTTLKIGKKEITTGSKKSYSQIKEDMTNKNLDLNMLSGFISQDIGMDTLSSDITSLNDSINKSYSGWQTRGAIRKQQAEINDINKRLDSYKALASLMGNEQLATEIGNTRTSYFQAYDNLRKLGESYKGFENAKHFGLSQMSLEEIEPHLKDKNKIAYTTKDGQNSTWQTLYDTKKYEQEQEQHFKELSSKSDFKEKSKYKSTKGSYKNWWDELNGGQYNLGYGDLVYEYINDEQPDIRTEIIKAQTTYQSDSPSLSKKTYSDKNYDRLNPNEVLEYNYWYAYDKENGTKKSEEYLESLSEILENRAIAESLANAANFAKEHPIIASAISIPQNMLSAFETVGDAVDYFKTGKVGTNHLAQLSSTIRGTVANQNDWNIGDWDAFDFTYNTGMSMVDSAVSNYLFGNAGGVVQGLSAAGQAMNDAKARGMDDDKAFWTGVEAGVAEGLFETLSFSKTKAFKEAPVDGTKTAFKNVAKSMFVNAQEEAWTEVANQAYDRFVNGEFSQYETQIRAYVQQGMSEDVAAYKVMWERIGQIAEAAGSGAVMGGIWGGINSRQAYNASKAIGGNVKDNNRAGEVFDIASNPEMKDAYDAYTAYAKKGVTAENATDAQVGALWQNARGDLEAKAHSKKSTGQEILFAKDDYQKLEEYAKYNPDTEGARSRRTYEGKENKDTASMLIDTALTYAEDTDAYKIAKELQRKKKITNDDARRLTKAMDKAERAEIKSSATEKLTTLGEGENASKIAEIITKKAMGDTLTESEQKALENSTYGNEVYDQIIDEGTPSDSEEVNGEEASVTSAKLTEKGVSTDVASLVAQKIKGEAISTEDAEKLIASDVDLSDDGTTESVTSKLLSRAKTMDKKMGATYVSMYDGKTDLDAYTNAFNLVWEKSSKNFTLKNILDTKSVLTGEQASKIYTEARINVDREQTAKFKQIIEKTAKMKAYKGKIDDSVIDYENKSTEGKVNWNDLTSRQRKSIEFIKGFAQATGLNLTLITDGKARGINGAFDINGNEIILDVFAEMTDVDTGKLVDSLIPTLSHELTHWMELKSPELYRRVNAIVFNTLQKHDGLSEDARIAKEVTRLLAKEYKAKYEAENPGKTISIEEAKGKITKDAINEALKDDNRINEARSEIVARACEDMLSKSKVGKEMFAEFNVKEQKTIGDIVKDLIQKLKDWASELLGLYKSDRYEAQVMRMFDERLDALSKAWDEMLKESVEVNQALEKSGEYKGFTDGGMLFQTRSVDGNSVVWIEENILKNNNGKPEHQFIADFIAEHIGDVYTIIESGQKVYIGEDLPNEYTQSKYTTTVLRYNSNIIKAKKRATANIGEIIEIATNRRWEKAKHPKNKDAKYGMYRYDTLFGFPVKDSKGNVVRANIYKAELVIRNASDGRKYLYDIVDIKKDTVLSEWMSNKTSSAAGKSAGQNNDISNGSISNSVPNVNTKFSDTDSNGRKLTKGQMEYFKDSKARDKDGNLILVFHGSPEFFTIFDTHKDTSSIIYDASFFTSDESRAKAYADKNNTTGHVYKGYVDIKNPLMPSKVQEQISFIPDSVKQKYQNEFDVDDLVSKTDYVIIDFAKFVAQKENSTMATVLKQWGFDGYINGNDYAIFEPEQFKDFDNTNPTKNKDYRYSDRTDTNIYDIMGERDRAVKRAQKLEEDVKRLKEKLSIERSLAKGKLYNESQLGAVAKEIKRLSNSTIDNVELMKGLKEVYNFIAEADHLTWGDVYNKSRMVAEKVVEAIKPSYEVDDYFVDMLSDIKKTKISLSESQKTEAQNIFGKNWNRIFFGRANITNDGTPIDIQWKEWARKYPNEFSENISDKDMLSKLQNIIDIANEASQTLVAYDFEERVNSVAREIYNKYWTISFVKTVSEKYNDKVKILNAKHREAIKEQRTADEIYFKAKSRAERRKLQQQHYERIKEIRKIEKERAKEYGESMIEGFKEKAQKNTLIQGTTSVAMSLNKKLTTNSKDIHIPETLKPVVIDFINAIDFSSKQLLGMKGTKKDNRYIASKADINNEKALSKVHGMRTETNQLKRAVMEAKKLFDKAGQVMAEDKGTDADTSLVALDSESVGNIDKLIEKIDDLEAKGITEYVLQKMDTESLKTLKDMAANINHWAIVADKALASKHKARISELGAKTIEDNEVLKKKANYNKAIESVFGMFNWRNTLPLIAFERFGNTAKQVFESLMDSQDTYTFNRQEIMNFTDKLLEKHDVKSWRTDIKSFELKLPNGDKKTIEMPVSFIMSLYCTAKQEDAQRHLYGEDASGGGITISSFKKGKLKAGGDDNNTVLSEKLVNQITSVLSKEQREVADALQKFMGEKGSEWGDSVSMALYGIKKFGVKDYFPLKVSPNEIEVKVDDTSRASFYNILNYSFTKDRVPGARQSIVIGDIFETFANHMNMMAVYNAYALSMYDIMRWYNFRYVTDKGQRKSVRGAISDAFGKRATEYISNLLRDLNGQSNSSRLEFVDGILKNTKISMVGASVSVVALQPTAYIRAMGEISPVYLMKSLGYIKDFGARRGIERAKKWCGIALLKSQGYFELGASPNTTKQLIHDTTVKEDIAEYSLKPAEWADELTWGMLWNACEFEIKAKRKDIKVGSEEYFKAVADRLREIIYKTQVVDSPLTKTDLMRSPDSRAKQWTMFGGEMATSYNQFYEAFFNISLDIQRNGRKGALKRNGKKIITSLTAYTLTNALAALAETVIQAFRDDDDEDKDFEEYLKQYFSNFILDQLVVGKIPYLKETLNYYQGFSSETAETKWIADAFDAAKYWWKVLEGDDEKIEKAVKKTLSSTSYLSGAPAYNIYRDVKALYNLLFD